MNTRLMEAWMVAREVHKDQRRKYTGNHYIEHLAEVAALTHIFTNGDEDSVIAAWLHDSVEDQGYKIEEIGRRFGYVAMTYVAALTELRPQGMNRAARHELYDRQLDDACLNVQLVKAGDIISNIKGIAEHDIKFGERYVAEKQLTLDHLTKVPEDVKLLVMEAIAAGKKAIEEKRLQDWFEKKEKQ